MRRDVPGRPSESLDADLARLERDQTLQLALDDLAGLLDEPDLTSFAPRRGPGRAGVDDLALTLSAAVRLPDRLTVRVLLPPGAAPSIPLEQAQAAVRRRAADEASAAWRSAMAVRSMGRRQLPAGLTAAVISACVAYGAGYLATSIDQLFVKSLLFVTAGIAITVAWVVSWMVIESSMLDWRQQGRLASAYDLIARATLEVVVEEPESG